MRATIAIIIVATWMPAAAADSTEGLVETLCKLTTQPTTTAMKEMGTVEQSRLPSGTAKSIVKGKTLQVEYMRWADPNDHFLSVSRRDGKKFFTSKAEARKWINQYGRTEKTTLSTAMVVADTGHPSTDRVHGWEFDINLPMDGVTVEWTDATAFRNQTFCK